MRAALILAGALALAACGGGEEDASQQSATVASKSDRLRVAASYVEELKDVGATITTRDQTDARVRIPGVLIDLRVREGDYVRKGQLIGSVVDSRLAQEAAAYGAQAAAAEAQAASARSELARTEFLYRNGVYAKARLEGAQASARAADAQVAAARAQQRAVQAVAGQGAILAPATGRVLRADVPAGSAVSPGMSVATITAGPPVLRIELPDSLAGKVRVGTRVVVTGLDNGAGGPAGYVTQVYPAVTAGRITADATVPGLGTQLVGRQVTARLVIGARKAIVVPRKFVASRFGVDQVTILGSNNQALVVPVQTAPLPDGRVEILSGVKAGDVLVAGAPQ